MTLRTYLILEILDDDIVVENKDDKIEKLINIKVPKFARVGDLIRYCEHNFYDVVDENGELVWR